MQILNRILGTVLIVGIVSGFMMVAYEDGWVITLFKKLKCRLGYHSIYVRFGKAKIHKYYCLVCKKPRNHPGLRIVDGGNKMKDNKFEF